MNRKVRLSFLLAVLALALTVTPALAAWPPLRVHIEAPTTIAPTADPFTASGPAVDAGLVCPAGEVTDLSNVATDLPGGRFRILRVLKQFDCDDASGTFNVRLLVLLDLETHYTVALWRVAGGTAAYASLRGNGTLYGVPIVPGASILDVYDGRVR